MQGPVPNVPGGGSWEALMDRALLLAAQSGAAGEVPVGALIVGADGAIVSEGYNCSCARNDPTAHAEIQALRAAGEALGNYRLDGCVLVVTLEPCAMCAAALVHARVDGLVFGACDLRAGAVISRMELLDQPFFNHRVWHMGGVRSEACMRQLQQFFSARR